MAIHLSMAELSIQSVRDLGAMDNFTPPPMDNAAAALGLPETAIDRGFNADFVKTMGFTP